VEFIVIWLACSIAAAVVASSKGRSGLGWFLLSALLLGVFGLLIVALAPAVPAGPPAEGGERMPCPACRESIMKDATVCRFCGTQLQSPLRGSAPARWRASGYYRVEVVGEASYQNELEAIAGRKTDKSKDFECKAVLTPESDNPHDANAVAVLITGRRVAYLSREDAVRYRAALARLGLAGQSVEADAIVVGAWDRGRRGKASYGLKLDIAQPLTIE
jgi:hypothetical protein